MPSSQKSHGVTEKERSLATAYQILFVHPPALMARMRAALVEPWHKRDQAKEAPLHLGEPKHAVSSDKQVYFLHH